MATPWWVCPIVAAIVYLGFAYLIPLACTNNPMSGLTAGALRVFAPYFAIFVLLIGLAAQVKKWRGGRLLDRQSGADTISSLTWQQFEMLIAAAYRRQGYEVSETGGGGADGGVDLVLHGKGEKVLVQCKQWRSFKVGAKEIREFHGILNSKSTNATRGIFVTFGEYTQESIRFAKENDIELVGKSRLLKMIAGSQKQTAVPTPAPAQEPQLPRPAPAAHQPTQSPPTCPICGQPMALRTARKGANAGSQFWGCTRYPKCRGIVAYE